MFISCARGISNVKQKHIEDMGKTANIAMLVQYERRGHRRNRTIVCSININNITRLIIHDSVSSNTAGLPNSVEKKEKKEQ